MNMKKLIAFIICIAVIFVFAGCSNTEQNNSESTFKEISNSTTEQTIVTNNKTAERTTLSDESSIINITEDEAKNIAYKALEEEYSSDEKGIDYTAFAFRDITLYHQSDDVYYNSLDAVKESGHSYYDVVYRNTNELCDIAYYFIDAYNGDVLFSGYMGD